MDELDRAIHTYVLSMEMNALKCDATGKQSTATSITTSSHQCGMQKDPQKTKTPSSQISSETCTAKDPSSNGTPIDTKIPLDKTIGVSAFCTASTINPKLFDVYVRSKAFYFGNLLLMRNIRRLHRLLPGRSRSTHRMPIKKTHPLQSVRRPALLQLRLSMKHPSIQKQRGSLSLRCQHLVHSPLSLRPLV